MQFIISTWQNITKEKSIIFQEFKAQKTSKLNIQKSQKSSF